MKQFGGSERRLHKKQRTVEPPHEVLEEESQACEADEAEEVAAEEDTGEEDEEGEEEEPRETDEGVDPEEETPDDQTVQTDAADAGSTADQEAAPEWDVKERNVQPAGPARQKIGGSSAASWDVDMGDNDEEDNVHGESQTKIVPDVAIKFVV